MVKMFETIKSVTVTKKKSESVSIPKMFITTACTNLLGAECERPDLNSGGGVLIFLVEHGTGDHAEHEQQQTTRHAL